MNTPKLICFEGGHRVGKTTLSELYIRHSNFFDVCLARGPVSNYAFSKIYHREFSQDALISFCDNYPKLVLVHMVAELQDILYREQCVKHRPMKTEEELRLVAELIDEGVSICRERGIQVIRLNSSTMSVLNMLRSLEDQLDAN